MAAAAGKSRPRFIVVLNADDLEKMVTKLKPSLLHTTILLTETSIQNENNVCTLLLFQRFPDEFVQEHMTDTHLSSKKAMIFSPLGKIWHVELDRDQPGVLLGDGWARFLTAHDISEGNILVFRYEDNMVFTVEVFMLNGCLKEYEAAAADMTDDAIGRQITVPQQGAPGYCTSPEWLQLCVATL